MIVASSSAPSARMRADVSSFWRAASQTVVDRAAMEVRLPPHFAMTRLTTSRVAGDLQTLLHQLVERSVGQPAVTHSG